MLKLYRFTVHVNPLSLVHIPMFVRLNMAQLGRHLRRKTAAKAPSRPTFHREKNPNGTLGTWIFPKYSQNGKESGIKIRKYPLVI